MANPVVDTPPARAGIPLPAVRSRQWILVLACAVAARLGFAALTHDTYDYDEFVILLLSRDFAHGAVPYQSFMFFHPPGILVFFRLLEPLTSLWWPLSRMLISGFDIGTTLLVWRIAQALYDRRTALIGALIYAFHPLALVASTRVSQDPVITFLGVLGLAVLVRRAELWGALAAGACMALATWVKFPSLIFLPIYAVARPRLFPTVVVGFVATLCALTLPFWPQHQALFDQTVTFQRQRWSMTWQLRLETVALFWILANPFAFPGLLRRAVPAWLPLGFAISALFVVTSQVYYHYFVLALPFAALLSAPVVSRLSREAIKPVVAGGVVLAVTCGTILDLGGSSPLLVTAAHLSGIGPTVQFIDRSSRQDEAVLADRLEYAYLSNRPALDDYFWNIGVLVDAQYLERRVTRARLVVLSYGASSGYPQGFVQDLNRSYRRIETKANTVWLVPAVAGGHR